MQAGYRVCDKLWLTGNVKRFATAGRSDPSRIFSSVGIGEGVEYTSYGLGGAYQFVPRTSATFDLSSAFGGVKNIYGGVRLSLGLAMDL